MYLMTVKIMYIAWVELQEPRIQDQHFFISESEQGKFARIERLFGHPVDKADLPEKFGKGPQYVPARNAQKKDMANTRSTGNGF